MPSISIRSQILKPKQCEVCSKQFQPNTSVHKFCSDKCRGLNQYITGYASTENQYKRINYNWRKYLQKLIYHKNRQDISLDYLLELIKKQDYKCALSGQPLTCVLNKGMKSFTNASLDRIIPGCEYKEGNVRLVCRIANIMKWNMSDIELKTWCARILAHGA